MGNNVTCCGPQQLNELPSHLKTQSSNIQVKVTHETEQLDGEYIQAAETPELSKQIQEQKLHLQDLKNEYNLEGTRFKPYLIKSNYIIYDGEWKNKKPHGRGNIYFQNGAYFEGFFEDGASCHKGRFFFANGDYYQGNTELNHASGHGVLITYDPKTKYQGEFKNNKAHGKGKLIESDSYFEGTFENGQKKQGKYIWGANDQFQYIGSFKHGEFDGHGILYTPAGEYQGQFNQGMKSGKGKFIWKNGKKYDGYYFNDVKYGDGTSYDAQGNILYKGNWENDQPNGQGTMYKNGKQISGTFYNSELLH